MLYSSTCYSLVADLPQRCTSMFEKSLLSKPEFNSQEIMGRFRQLSPDGSECGCMKAVILFTPGELLYSHAFIYMHFANKC